MQIDWTIAVVILIDAGMIISWTVSAISRESLHHISYQRYPSRVCVDQDNLLSLYMSPYLSYHKLALVRQVIGLYC